MRQENDASFGSSLVLFLAGAAVGAVVVALVTPRSGPELREDITAFGRRNVQRAEHLAQGARDTWDKVRGRAAKAAEDVGRGMAEAGRGMAEAGRSVAEAVNDIRC